MNEDQKRKAEVLKFTNNLRAAGITKVTVSYHGEGDEGHAECPQLEDAAGNPIDASPLPEDTDIEKLGDLLADFVPEGYQDGEGGHGTITFDVVSGKIRVEHNWYETVSNPDEPREI